LDVSIIIPTRDGAARIAPTIESVLRSMRASGLACELVVVDNASTSELAPLVAARWRDAVRCIPTNEIGASNARNLGVSSSTGSVVLFCDDDATVPDGWVALLSAPLRAGTADIVGGAVHLADDLLRPDMTPYHRRLLADTGDGFGSPPRTVHGVSMGAVRRVFDDGLWFHPELGAGRSGFMEEHAWLGAATGEGFRATWVEGAPVLHRPALERFGRAAWLSRARRQGASEALARALYTDDRISPRDVARVVHAAARQARFALAERHAPLPSEAYLRAVATAQHAVGFLRERRRHPVARRGWPDAAHPGVDPSLDPGAHTVGVGVSGAGSQGSGSARR
jgi:glycosyltransferase involved in cell wall biosynthesis